MHPFDDDDDEAAPSPNVTAQREDEAALVRRAASGDSQAFDLLYDRYFARISWYFFTIFGKREAKAAVAEALAELFGSLGDRSALSFAERAYRISIATELRHAKPVKTSPAKVGIPKKRSLRHHSAQA